jgi:CBS domain-containing protein
MQDVSRNVGVGDAMITHFETLSPQATIADAAELLLRTTQHEFPVVDGGGRLRGLLTRNAMIKALSKSGPGTPVLDVMTGDIPTVSGPSRLEAALKLLQEAGAPAVGVLDMNGRLAGYITPENVGELMLVRNAGIGGKPPARPTGPLLPQ